MKRRQCKHCKKRKPIEQMLIRGLDAFCSQEHFIEYAAGNVSSLAAKGRAITSSQNRKRKEKLKTRNDHLADAQREFNKFIRLRDRGEPCISCGRSVWQVESQDAHKSGGKWDAGHFISRGAKPELRFCEENVHKQCKTCNGGAGKYAKKNHTVQQSYRENLILKIGIERVEWLEGAARTTEAQRRTNHRDKEAVPPEMARTGKESGVKVLYQRGLVWATQLES